MIAFETARLRVAEIDDESAAAAALVQVLSPNVAAPLPPSLQTIDSVNAAAAWIAGTAPDERLLAVRRADDDDIVGFVILRLDGGAAHIGYFLAEDQWGQGLGSELVRGLVAWAEGADAVSQLIGIAADDNAASIATMKRAGFVRDETVETTPGMVAFSRRV